MFMNIFVLNLCFVTKMNSVIFKIFKSEASDVTHKIKVNTSRTGAKALLRVAVEELTKQFSASLVNLFCG